MKSIESCNYNYWIRKESKNQNQNQPITLNILCAISDFSTQFAISTPRPEAILFNSLIDKFDNDSILGLFDSS